MYVHVFFIYPCIDAHLGYFHILAIVSNAAVNNGLKHLVKLVFSFSLNRYPEVELLGHPAQFTAGE